MDIMTSTENLTKVDKSIEENLLLELIKEICSERILSPKVCGKVNRIIADCDLGQHTSLHKLSTADERTSTLLGLMQQTSLELSYDEQSELNEAIIQKIQNKIPKLNAELEHMQNECDTNKVSRKDKVKDLQESLDEKLNLLEEQEKEKVNLMMEWLNHRLHEVNQFSENTTELLNLKSGILELKSKILYLQILQNIFTETNQSIKSYAEVHKDLTKSIRDTEHKIKEYEDIINNDVHN